MKNIHLLPTDKPSKLHYSKEKGYGIVYKLILNQEESKCDNGLLSGQRNIYITSEEEIKEGDWYLSYGKTPTLCSKKNFENPKTLKVENEIHQSGHKKIIITTDLDLIEDGVQGIDDTFLEWFVKNPTCEFVEVKKVRQRSHLSLKDWVDEDENGDFPMSIAGAFSYRMVYKIIIPQEEPKQETLEEAAERLCPNSSWKHGFIAGANWQAETMYSEEDFKLFARQYYREIRLNKSNLLWDDLADKCLEQFKKK